MASESKHDVLARLVPGGAHGLAHLSDEELLANTRRLVGKSNQLFAALLIHLAEVETRGIHRSRRCASLYTYCIYELRFSEDAAARRSSAARLVKAFPPLFDAVANGELHLTGLLMIGPHLTPENHVEVLGRAKFRTKKELAKLVRELSPLPRVPDLIEPLGPELTRAPRNPTWEQLVQSFCPPVRELPPGERPRDWANDGLQRAGEVEPALPVGPVPADLPPVTGPQQFQVQFSTIEEHVELVERAKALLARERPGATLGELHLEAMRLFVAALEKRKFAVTERPRKPKRMAPHDAAPPAGSAPAASPTPPQPGEGVAEVRRRLTQAEAPRRRGGEVSPRRSRYVPAAERREVYRRDAGCCTFVDARGERCRETRYLELHHLKPFAKEGANVASNLTLRCVAHNALAAEQDFGREHIAQKRDRRRHESLVAQLAATAEK